MKTRDRAPPYRDPALHFHAPRLIALRGGGRKRGNPHNREYKCLCATPAYVHNTQPTQLLLLEPASYADQVHEIIHGPPPRLGTPAAQPTTPAPLAVGCLPVRTRPPGKTSTETKEIPSISLADFWHFFYCLFLSITRLITSTNLPFWFQWTTSAPRPST